MKLTISPPSRARPREIVVRPIVSERPAFTLAESGLTQQGAAPPLFSSPLLVVTFAAVKERSCLFPPAAWQLCSYCSIIVFKGVGEMGTPMNDRQKGSAVLSLLSN